MNFASFLSVFRNVMHAAQIGATLSAPIVALYDPTIGALMLQATNAAVAVEAAIPDPGSGAVKAAAVAAGTQATVDAINGILVSQNKKPLPANITDIVAQQVVTVVSGLNAVAAGVTAAPAVPVA